MDECDLPAAESATRKLPARKSGLNGYNRQNPKLQTEKQYGRQIGLQLYKTLFENKNAVRG
jgi:hypothetical protein